MSIELRDHYVYRAYDADGVLLYVGLTKQPRECIRQHLKGDHDLKGWFGEFVDRWVFTGPPPREAAFKLEAATILEVQPVFNGNSNGNIVSIDGRSRVTHARPLIAAYFKSRGLKYPRVSA